MVLYLNEKHDFVMEWVLEQVLIQNYRLFPFGGFSSLQTLKELRPYRLQGILWWSLIGS